MFDLTQVESVGSGAIKPGAEVKVKLEKVVATEDGNLDFYFKGSDPANAGSFKPRFWGNNFDSTDPKYDAANAGNQVKQLKQLLEAYLTNDQIALVKGGNAPQFFAAVAQALNPNVTANVEAKIKIVYKWKSDTDCQFPKFGPFISTEFRPKGLALGAKKGTDGVPYDRVLPMATYGVVADTGAPSEGGFGEIAAPVASADDVPFGN